MKVGHSGTGVFIQSGGTNTVSNGLYLGYYAGSNGTYILDGGTLILKSLSKGSGTAAFKFGAGTLQASGDFSTTLPMTLTGNGGNANVDTASYSVTLSGKLSGPGGLNKQGLGNSSLDWRQRLHRHHEHQRGRFVDFFHGCPAGMGYCRQIRCGCWHHADRQRRGDGGERRDHARHRQFY